MESNYEMCDDQCPNDEENEEEYESAFYPAGSEENLSSADVVDFVERLLNMEQDPTSFDFGTGAKLLNIPDFGRTKLFRFCRDEGYLQKNNIPYQKWINQKYFEVEYIPYGDGNSQLFYAKPRITILGLAKLEPFIRQYVEDARKDKATE